MIENFEQFQYFNFEAKTFFKKLKHCFLVESTKIEIALFPYKTVFFKSSPVIFLKRAFQLIFNDHSIPIACIFQTLLYFEHHVFLALKM